MVSDYDNGPALARVRQNTEGVPRLVASDPRHGGADQALEWVRNNVADPMVMTSTAAAAHNTGEPEESKGDHTAEKRK